jgi:transcriptional regulator with PAS, ATPase and Fis domain
LARLVRFIARRVAGDDEADALTDEVVAWIEGNLGSDYAWPGNVRELEQCVRNIMIRRAYCPTRVEPSNEVEALLDGVRDGQWTADELLGRYCKLVYGRTGSYLETAKRLQLDRRTVKRRVESRQK